jgi:hypothetical protein
LVPKFHVQVVNEYLNQFRWNTPPISLDEGVVRPLFQRGSLACLHEFHAISARSEPAYTPPLVLRESEIPDEITDNDVERPAEVTDGFLASGDEYENRHIFLLKGLRGRFLSPS